MNDKVKKLGAVGILTTSFSGLLLNAYSQVRDNQIQIARIIERQKAVKEIVIEIKKDVEFIKRHFEKR